MFAVLGENNGPLGPDREERITGEGDGEEIIGRGEIGRRGPGDPVNRGKNDAGVTHGHKKPLPKATLLRVWETPEAVKFQFSPSGEVNTPPPDPTATNLLFP